MPQPGVSASLRAGVLSGILLLTAVAILPGTTRDAAALFVSHTVGNVQADVADNGRIMSLVWNGVNQLCRCPYGTDTELGLAIDQANYDHAPRNGPGQDNDGRFVADSFEGDMSVYRPIYFEENTPAVQRSSAVFNHSNPDPADANPPFKEVGDLSIEETAWTAAGTDWIVLRWEVFNRKATSVSGLRFTLYGSYSGPAPVLQDYRGVGDTAGNDVESWDAGKATYYVRDLNGAPGATTLAVTSADAARPLDRYVTHPAEPAARDVDNDDVFYSMTTVEANGLGSGVTDGISSVLGWGASPISIPAGATTVFSMILAFGTSVAAADAALAGARAFYLAETTSMEVAEVADTPAFKVEVWDNGMGLVDLSTWTVSTLGGGVPGAWTPTSVNSGGHAVFTASGGAVGTEADVLTVRDGLGVIQATAGWGWLGPVPDPLPGESSQRAWDAGTGAYSDDWSRATTTTWGAVNTVAPHDPAPTVVLNEVLFNAATRDAFLEVYYRGVTSVDLSGYRLVVDQAYSIPGGTILDTTRRWFVLRAPAFPPGLGLTALADNVYIYSPGGVFLDMVGWSTAHTADLSVLREPDGNGTFDGYDDATSAAAGWRLDSVPTMNLVGLREAQARSGNIGTQVEFFLNATNYKPDVDTLDITVASGPNGWGVELLTVARTPLPNTGAGLPPDTGLLGPMQTATFVVRVTIPPQPPVGREELVAVTAQSFTDAEVSARVVLHAQVYPHLEITKTAAWTNIYVNGTPMSPDYAPVTLTLTGEGVPQVDQRPQDVVFEVDNSGSMTQWPYFSDPGNLRWDALACYIQQMALPDRGAIVAFGDPSQGGTQSVAWYVDHPLTSNYAQLYADTQNPANRFGSGGTPIKEALQLGNAELFFNGSANSTWVEVLITDGIPNNADVAAELALAIQYDIRIFTIGLGPYVDEFFLRNIADTTGGRYYFADSPDDLCTIYETIGTIVQDIAAKPPPGGLIPMVQDRVPDPFDVVPGTVSPPPTAQYTDANGDEVLEWQVSTLIRVGQSWSAGYRVKCNEMGMWNATHWPDAVVNYEAWDGASIRGEIPSLLIACWPVVPLGPPRDARTAVSGDDIAVTWLPPLDPTPVNGYYLYASATPTGFDLQNPTATVALSLLPWLDVGAANATGERYYVLRAFNTTYGEVSETSNTAGKFTVSLGAGTQAVSYPLEPFVTLPVPSFQAQIAASAVLELSGGAWVPAAGSVAVGEGYLVDRTASGLFTYVGRPAAHILYRENFGFGYGSAAVSLQASVTGNAVSLTWLNPGIPFVQFAVYRSLTRTGFFDGTAVELARVTATSYVDSGGLALADAAYYMVVPVNPMTNQMGGSTYSIGVVRLALPGQAAIGLPLLPLSNGPVSWYTARILAALGLLWFDAAAGVWVPHFRDMPPGVYDAPVAQARAYQVSTRLPTTYVFVGW